MRYLFLDMPAASEVHSIKRVVKTYERMAGFLPDCFKKVTCEEVDDSSRRDEMTLLSDFDQGWAMPKRQPFSIALPNGNEFFMMADRTISSDPQAPTASE
jgi:hypothetical protein